MKKKLEAAAVMAPDDDKYKVDDAVRSLMQAEEIKADPELYKKAQAKMKEKMGHMKKLTSTEEMRDLAKKMEKMEGEDD